MRNVVLALSPHTDDAELGAGGTLARLAAEGLDVHVAAFSIAEASVPGPDKERLLGEFQSSMSAAGFAAEQTTVLRFPVREFDSNRQEILEELIKLRSRISPTLVLLPSLADVHQDHGVLSREGLRAFKSTSIWGYELPWNIVDSNARRFVVLERWHVEKKWAMLQNYRSQIELRRPYFSLDAVVSQARFQGLKIGTQYAEAFEPLREIMPIHG